MWLGSCGMNGLSEPKFWELTLHLQLEGEKMPTWNFFELLQISRMLIFFSASDVPWHPAFCSTEDVRSGQTHRGLLLLSEMSALPTDKAEALGRRRQAHLARVRNRQSVSEMSKQRHTHSQAIKPSTAGSAERRAECQEHNEWAACWWFEQTQKKLVHFEWFRDSERRQSL